MTAFLIRGFELGMQPGYVLLRQIHYQLAIKYLGLSSLSISRRTTNLPSASSANKRWESIYSMYGKKGCFYQQEEKVLVLGNEKQSRFLKGLVSRISRISRISRESCMPSTLLRTVTRSRSLFPYVLVRVPAKDHPLIHLSRPTQSNLSSAPPSIVQNRKLR